MIDFHTHILPGIDDGSRNSEESIQMLNLEQEQGITKIVFTPHFYANRNSVERFLKRREASYERLLSFAGEQRFIISRESVRRKKYPDCAWRKPG